MHRCLAVLSLAVAAAACVSTNMALLDPSVRLAPICPDGVALFTAADRVGKEFREVAILNSSGETGSTSERGMYDSMRKKAAEAGANGIILGNIVEPNAGTKIVGALFGTGSQRKGTSTAIYIPSDSTRVQEACNGVENRATTQS